MNEDLHNNKFDESMEFIDQNENHGSVADKSCQTEAYQCNLCNFCAKNKSDMNLCNFCAKNKSDINIMLEKIRHTKACEVSTFKD